MSLCLNLVEGKQCDVCVMFGWKHSEDECYCEQLFVHASIRGSNLGEGVTATAALHPAAMSVSVLLPVWHIPLSAHMQHGFILSTSCNLLPVTARGNKDTDSVWSLWWPCPLFPFLVQSAGSLLSLLSDVLPFWVVTGSVWRQKRSKLRGDGLHVEVTS